MDAKYFSLIKMIDFTLIQYSLLPDFSLLHEIRWSANTRESAEENVQCKSAARDGNNIQQEAVQITPRSRQELFLVPVRSEQDPAAVRRHAQEHLSQN